MKNALVIAGGLWQVPLIEYLKKEKYQATVVDPYDNSKGVLIANRHIKRDVRDRLGILSDLDRKYDFVCTDQSDISVETVAFLSEKLNLNGNKEDVVQKFTNKYLSRQYADSINIPIPAYTEVCTINQIKEFIRKHNCPLMLKPCDSQSSKGIHKINTNVTDTELEVYLEDALSYSQIKKAILEEFIDGYEITVEGFCANGKHRVLAISKKKHFKTGIASSLTYPAPLSEDLERRIVDADNKYVNQSGLSFGPTHAEYIINEQTGKFYLVEIACRGGGTLISSDIVKWVSGFDVYQAYLSCLQGENVDVYGCSLTRKSAELHFFDFGSGKIKTIYGMDEVSGIEGVHKVDFGFKEGDIINSCEDDRSRQGFFIVFADDSDTLKDRVSKVVNTFKVILE